MEAELPDAAHLNQAEIANPQLFAPLVEYFEHQLYLVHIMQKLRTLRVSARTRMLRWRLASPDGSPGLTAGVPWLQYKSFPTSQVLQSRV